MSLGRRITMLSVGVATLLLTGSFQLPIPSASANTSLTWELQTTANGIANQWDSIAYGDGVFVAVGGYWTKQTNVATSVDGVNWVARTSIDPDGYFKSIAYGNGTFVAVGKSYGTYGSDVAIMTSEDKGVSWTRQPYPEYQGQNSPYKADEWVSVAFGNGVFVAITDTSDIGHQEKQVMTSSDGKSWTVQTEIAGTQTWESVTFSNGLFLATGYVVNDQTGGRIGRIMTSTNGTQWTAQTDVDIEKNGWKKLAYGNNTFVALAQWFADSGDLTKDRVLTSVDGVNWAVSTLPVTSNEALYSLVYGEGVFVALTTESSSTGTYMYTSVDGVTWTQSSVTVPLGNWAGLVYAGGLFIAADWDGRIMTSGTFTPPAVTPPAEQTPPNNASATPTTAAATPSTTVATKVKKQNTLPETGSSSSTPLLIGTLLLAGGVVVSLRRRIMN